MDAELDALRIRYRANIDAKAENREKIAELESKLEAMSALEPVEPQKESDEPLSTLEVMERFKVYGKTLCARGPRTADGDDLKSWFVGIGLQLDHFAQRVVERDCKATPVGEHLTPDSDMCGDGGWYADSGQGVPKRKIPEATASSTAVQITISESPCVTPRAVSVDGYVNEDDSATSQMAAFDRKRAKFSEESVFQLALSSAACP